MGSNRTPLSDRARFGWCIAGFAVLFLVVGRVLGEDIALQLQKTPTTVEGWLFVGWLVGGPPYLVTAIFWNERHRLTRTQLRNRSVLLAAWIGLTMLIVPARVLGVHTQFGTGALVGNPLSAGWVWGMAANVGMLVFGGLVLLVLHKSTPKGPGKGPSAEQRRMTARFLEAAWLVALVVTLGLSLYGGNGSGIFNNGT
ncbi:hypothetical protein EFK50_09865 [Nocardioides marmoriginsengisoli]|uniref:Uncharacterized protein n=1 Tax=Nocardioides marmoriginsengisoli TaxID=661483 RepID=A0A3N0CF96_9ACTN|nr:hypothetical protein [Nocardioides marmoriginsengisoli]RNL62108.1 hypothetical protein EFK50_09865 [Nocardioides marmoriginsengisoli]